jgi:hypothetical protein
MMSVFPNGVVFKEGTSPLLFCERLSIEFGPPYAPLIIADQLVMPFEEES